eukprot:10033572-Lingulodinium_polyedra.AAC.1
MDAASRGTPQGPGVGAKGPLPDGMRYHVRQEVLGGGPSEGSSEKQATNSNNLHNFWMSWSLSTSHW